MIKLVLIKKHCDALAAFAISALHVLVVRPIIKKRCVCAC